MRLRPLRNPVTLELDGEPVEAEAGEPVAAALLAAGVTLFSRSPKYHRPRGAFCLSGGCAQCAMRVDGLPSVRTCQLPARSGLRLERQHGFPDASVDLLAAVDLAFPRRIDHHGLFTGIPHGDTLLTAVTALLTGPGRLPDAAPSPAPPAALERAAVAIVGAGVAGSAASARLAELGVVHVVLEAGSTARLHFAATTPSPVADLRLGALVVGLYADGGAPCLAVHALGRLTLLAPELTLLAHGGHPTLPVFPGNDLPGVFAASALRRLVADHGVLPGRTIAVCGDPAEAAALAELLADTPAHVVGVGRTVRAALGRRRLRAVELAAGAGRPAERLPCDALAVCGPVSPSHELAAAAGARVAYHRALERFVVETDGVGLTAHPHVYAAGLLAGAADAAEAERQGRRAADAIAARLAAPAFAAPHPPRGAP